MCKVKKDLQSVFHSDKFFVETDVNSNFNIWVQQNWPILRGRRIQIMISATNWHSKWSCDTVDGSTSIYPCEPMWVLVTGVGQKYQSRHIYLWHITRHNVCFDFSRFASEGRHQLRLILQSCCVGMIGCLWERPIKTRLAIAVAEGTSSLSQAAS